jgi:acyl CoA:acetate/3-ketoacid CoA transferase alpha subunit
LKPKYLIAGLTLLLATTIARATIEDALSFALEAATPYVKEGFTVREDYWGGDLPVKQQKAIVHQLFKGNEYWFWMGTSVDGAKISVHIYDSEGNLAEAEASQSGKFAMARVVPKSTGSYYIIVEVEKSPEERTAWALAYGFR